MNINNVSAEMFVKMGLMNNVLKSAAGDGLEFEIMYQSLLEAASKKSDNTTNKNTTENTLSNIMETAAGQRLQDLQLIMNPSVGYNNSYWNTNINSKDQDITNQIGSTNEIKELKNNQKDAKMKQIYNTVNKYSKIYGVDPNFVLGVIKAESDFNPNTTSGVGAMGLMQLMPVTAKEEGVTNAYDIDQGIRGGVAQLSKHLKKYNGNKEMALMAYNAGMGTVMRRGVKSPGELYKMPKETQNYVPKVMKYYNEFKTKNN